jgi:hypothetical protein
MQKLSSICGLRITVAHLGEKSHAGWWDTAFLNTTGFRYLELICPKTAASACVTPASEAACRAHDERIGKGHVGHLFRLSLETEAKLRSELAALTPADIAPLCSPEGASRFLNDLADGAKAPDASGPIHVGSLKELETAKGLQRLAATYAAGFKSGTRVFPYFA